MQKSVRQRSVLNVTSSVIVARSDEFVYVFISLVQPIINKCYILHIFSQYRFFHATWSLTLTLTLDHYFELPKEKFAL